MLTRREALTLAVGAATAAALPTVPVEAAAPAPAAPVLSWVVGTDGEYDWQHVTGKTAEEAIRNFVCEAVGGDGCEEGNDPDCDCEWCYKIKSVDADRAAAFDGKADIKPGDWIRAGLGHLCSRCGSEAHPEVGAHGVGAEAVCEDCMTLDDWAIVDPERAAEMREEETA